MDHFGGGHAESSVTGKSQSTAGSLRRTAVAGLLARLEQIAGTTHVITDAGAMTPFTRDWTGSFGGPALAVVLPADADQVAAVVMACAVAGASVLPQGGNTGLVGGGVPGESTGPSPDVDFGPPVIISTRRLQTLSAVDSTTGHVYADAGVTLERLQEHAASAGWQYGIDLAARGSATLGGTIATNAGGIRVCAYGMTRAQVISVEAVLANGSIVRRRTDLPKDNTGYDLSGLMVGSEGTLGVITGATVRLHRPCADSVVALIALPDYASAIALMRQAVPSSETLLAAEIMDRAGTRSACDSASLAWPTAREAPLLLLLEITGSLVQLPEDCDAVVAVDHHDARRLWRYRELAPEAILACRDQGEAIQKLDIGVPLSALPQFAAKLADSLDASAGVDRWSVFGHLAEGNLHVQLAGPAAGLTRAATAVLELVATYGGSISAEHGIGRAKVSYLHLSRSDQEVAAMRAIKRALDPNGMFAPGVIFPPTG